MTWINGYGLTPDILKVRGAIDDHHVSISTGVVIAGAESPMHEVGVIDYGVGAFRNHLILGPRYIHHIVVVRIETVVASRKISVDHEVRCIGVNTESNKGIGDVVGNAGIRVEYEGIADSGSRGPLVENIISGDRTL